MFFDLDRLNFMAPFTNDVRPTEGNREKDHQLFKSLRVGHLGGFQIETSGFQANEQRFDGHLFITVLAYPFVQIIRRHLKEQGIAGRWDTLREILGSQCRVTATFRRADGRILHVRKATRPEPEALAIYQALNLNPAPAGIVKMIV